MSSRLLRAVLLDFGGTLDSEGLHWSTQFALAFAAAGAAVSRPALDQAFARADRTMNQLPSVEALSYRAHLEEQARLMAVELGLPDALAGRVADAFEQRARQHLQHAVALLQARAGRFHFGVVSNFTANLPRILDEVRLSPLLETAICSSRVCLRKPDPAIYRRALQELGLAAEETAMIGDSLPNDVAPAKLLGLTTIWLRGDRVFGRTGQELDERAADFVVRSLDQALQICDDRSASGTPGGL